MLYLQSEFFGLIALILLILVIVIPIVIWKSRKRTNQQNYGYDPNVKFADTLTNVPTKQEVDTIKERLQALTEFQDKQNLEIVKHLENISKKNEEEVKEKMVEQVTKLLKESTAVTRPEIDRITERLDKIQVDDSDTQKIMDLGKIFNSTKQSVINWKCDLLKLLHNGVAPDIDAERFARESIPNSSARSFLKELVSKGIADQTKIDSFSLNENYEWISSYIDKPVWLKEQIERTKVVKKEKEYQKWLRNNLEKIERGLLKEEREVTMQGTGTIDFLCRDENGKPVGLELKYPKAAKKDVKQLMAYAEEYRSRADGLNFRGIMVAPEIVQELKDSLTQYNLEYKEVSFDVSQVEEKAVSGALIEEKLCWWCGEKESSHKDSQQYVEKEMQHEFSEDGEEKDDESDWRND